MNSPPLRFTLNLNGRGSLEALLSDGTNQAMLTAYYLSDAITELLLICISLGEGAQEGQCSWQAEPGEYRWLFTRHEDKIEIRILWFKETFSKQLDEKGECLFIISCPLLKFATKLKNQLDQLLATWGDEGYKEQWGYPLNNYFFLDCPTCRGLLLGLLRMASHEKTFRNDARAPTEGVASEQR